MRRFPLALALTLCATACQSDASGEGETDGETDTDQEEEVDEIYRFAGGCYAVADGQRSLAATATGDGFAFVDGGGSRFFMKASDLATYLLYDEDGGYVVAEDGPLLRQTSLQSDVLLIDDAYVSGAEWELQVSSQDAERFQLRHHKTGSFLGAAGLVPDEGQALALSLTETEGCLPHPELSIDASGEIAPPVFDDGSVFGIVDTHSHIMSNFAFGGGGIFHGAPFHRLGVAHALSDCSLYHGTNGRKDFFGFAFDSQGADGTDLSSLFPSLIAGELEQDAHQTAGWPDFTDWPNGPRSSTHQTQYYRWLQRAHLAGLRLVVQHATTNAVICQFMVGQGLQQTRYGCDDMIAVDRIFTETHAMERYIDAQEGGPGLGWFRIVHSPAQAREVIADGKLAVVLGIETSDPFGCMLTPTADSPVCDETYVRQQLDYYYELGVRAVFPVHKYDNAFSAGDGDRAFIEVGNFFHSGHWSNFVEDCPDIDVVFDEGNVAFGGLNMPRDDFLAPPVHDFSDFPDAPIANAFPFLTAFGEPALEGDYCQNAGLTPLGETLMAEMMARGMIIELDHMPRRSYARALEILEANDYPAAGTHGNNAGGRLYALGGISKVGLGGCRDPAQPGATLQRMQERLALITANGGYPAEGLGLDLNGFAGAPGPRFGGACEAEQTDPVTYPFDSYAGDVTFTQPFVGNRAIDFNTEGLVHIGMLPELIEDARGDAVSDADLEPLFRSAEAYLRMWEKAEARAAELAP